MFGSRPASNCLFEECWWLDLTAPGGWHSVEVRDGTELVARWPYATTTVCGLSVLCMPHLTQTLGPWLKDSHRGCAKALSLQHRLLEALVSQLPEHDLFVQSFHYSRWNWLPMHWHGFKTTARVTYLLENTRDLDQIWRGMRTDVRTQIRRGKASMRVRADGSADEFVPLHMATFARQGLALPWPEETARSVIAGACARGQGRVFVAEDEAHIASAAVVVVWDSRTMYYLLAGSDAKARQCGAIALLIWEAIRFASELNLSFDFEGSMLPRVERMFRAFGAVQRPYLQLWRSNGRIEALAQHGELPPDTFLRLRNDQPNLKR